MHVVLAEIFTKIGEPCECPHKAYIARN